jgi:hypothetical protein
MRIPEIVRGRNRGMGGSGDPVIAGDREIGKGKNLPLIYTDKADQERRSG